MGRVYKAVDPTIGRTVALKTMRLDVHGLDTDEMLRRFKNEARLAGVLNHGNIVTIYDAGEQDGLFYIAMEYIEGVTLHSVLNQRKTLPAEDIISISKQICAGLDHAHHHGVIHRDVKPANVMLEPDGTAKIIHENPVPPRELDVTIHPGLDKVIMKALAKKPDERYQTGAELARDLQSYKSLGTNTD